MIDERSTYSHTKLLRIMEAGWRLEGDVIIPLSLEGFILEFLVSKYIFINIITFFNIYSHIIF